MATPHLPQEILDYVIDLLHDEPETLRRCYLVSKSWVPRTRKHLFADVELRSASDLESWKWIFPDVAHSPAHQTQTLFVGCPQLITESDAEEGGWIRAFSGVKSLDVDNGDQHFITSEVSLTPFYKFSPSLKSLRVAAIILPHPGLFDLILSFPLLEDLTLAGYKEPALDDDGSREPQTIVPSASPIFTGSLEFGGLQGAGDIARQLLDLPGGLHFRRLALARDDRAEALQWMMELVAKCSHTLESLDVAYSFRLGSESASFDLLKATKLRDLTFRSELLNPDWITMALQTVTPLHRDLRQISIYLPYYLLTFLDNVGDRRTVGEAISSQWYDLDRFLVQIWKLHSIRPKVGYAGSAEDVQNMEFYAEYLFPEMTRRGIVDPM